MAVKIRLKRMGKIRAPYYRIVVADSRTKRDGRVIEEIGTYNPKTEPSTIAVDSDRAKHWLSVGAQPTEAVAAILKITGDLGDGKSTLKTPAAKRDKAEAFNEALSEIHAEPKAEATTAKKPAKKKADEPKAEEAAEAPAAEAPAAETPAAEAETPADES